MKDWFELDEEAREKCSCVGCLAVSLFLVPFSGELHSAVKNVFSREGNFEGKSSVESLILNYQRNVRPVLDEKFGGKRICIYEPSCSEYGLEAVRKYGDFQGGIIAARRIIRCNPFAEGGFDPLR